MGREVRRVPLDFEHPRDERGRYIPLMPASSYEGFCADYEEDPEEWGDGKPRREDYMPNFGVPEQELGWCMYEDTSEGTPISPVFATPEKLGRWLADSGASAFADMTATYEEWMATIRQGWAVSMVWSPSTGFVSGVEDANGG